MSKKDFKKFSKRNTHKRRSKDAAKKELLRAIKETGVSAPHVKIKASFDGGRRSRSSRIPFRDEAVERGIFSSSKSGFGFVSVEGKERDVFIPEDKTLGAIDGDFVEIIYHEFKNRFGEQKTEGRVRKILEFGRKTLIGTVTEKRIRHGRHIYRSLVLIPDDPHISMRLYIDNDGGARDGDKIEAIIKRDGTSHPSCDTIRIFGDTESREANYEAILADEGIITDFTPEELSEAKKAAAEPLSKEGRALRTDEIIFTIDGAGAKDLDDAVSLKRLPGGKWRLGVHIADVSHYVKERTPLDRAVMARGTSVYFTDKVVPMLPPELSNGACSLNAGEEKYTVSAVIDIDSLGEIVGVNIEPSIIKSRVRGVYSEVNEIFEGTADKVVRAKYKEVIPTLTKMRELYGILKKKNATRGALDFDAPEAEIILDEDGIPNDIIRRERGEAERLIEQFMLTANEAVATYLYERKIPTVYRIHEAPPEDKLADFVNYAHNLGFDTSVITKEGADARAFSRLLSASQERGLFSAVSYSMLRAMSKARYSEIKSPHFGLGIDTYCHFTSPIRRLSDLATHRIIKRVLFEEKRPQLYAGYAKRAAAAATEGELRAVSAERRIENLYKVIYMGERLGEEFDATVSSVTAYGLFCELENTCEGLIPISEMPGAFVFDQKNITLRSGELVYRIADKIRIRVEEADIIRGKLRFSLVENI